MISLVERPADGGHVAGHAGCRFVVADDHTLDLVRGIGGEAAGSFLGRRAFAPLDLDFIDIEIVTPTQVGPEMGKLAEIRDDDLIARREGVADRGFPAAGARGGKDEDLSSRGLEVLLEIFLEYLRLVRAFIYI